MVQLGICVDSKNVGDVLDIGFDYAVLPGAEVSALSEDEFKELETLINVNKWKIKAFNSVLPAGFDMVGPRYNEKMTCEYIKKIMERGNRLGIECVGIGSPGSRCVPNGYKRDMAYRNGISFLRIAAKEAERLGLNIALEALNQTYCNFINTVRASYEMVVDSGVKNGGIIIDFFHTEVQGETPEMTAEFLPYAMDLHISGIDEQERPGRPFVNELDRNRLERIASVLRETGYNGGIALEADPVSEDLLEKASISFRIMKEIFCN